MSNRLLISTYNIIERKNNNEKYDLTSLSKACDFVAIKHIFYHEGIKHDLFKDPTVLRRFDYFEKVINFTSDVSNVVYGINFDFGKYTVQDGKYRFSDKMAYGEFCESLSSRKCEKSFDTEIGMTTVKGRDELLHNDFVFSYASSRSVANQVRFAMKRHFGGFIISTLEDDDFLGMCHLDADAFEDFKADGVVFDFPNRSDATFPLLRTINESIVLTLDEMQQQSNQRNVTTTSRSSRIEKDVSLLLSCILMFLLGFHANFFIATILNLQWK